MKKFLLFPVLLFLFAYNKADAQSFVSTEPSNKNVVLEEFTGVGCQFCPDGHKRAAQLKANNPGRVCLINIHQGSYANTTPNYRTAFGDALANQTGLDGYPSGTVNRHVFSGSKTALNRGQWTQSGNIILGTVSPVNVAARATLDFATREITVDVEAYYTGNSAVPNNFLNVAVLQNNVIGRQVGASGNPDQVVGAQYRHMHMLRHLITGQWGDTIPTTVAGTLVQRQYTYTAPEQINNVEMVLEDLEVVVFIAEGHQEILTGADAEVSYLNGKPKIKELKELMLNDCFQARFSTTITNFQEEDVTSVTLKYTLDGTEETLDWNARVIPYGHSDTILLPVFDALGSHSASLLLESYNTDQEPYPASPYTATLTKATGNGYMSLKLVTDSYGSETSFKIFKEDGSVLLQKGPFNDVSKEYWYAIKPPVSGCYMLEVYDSYGDGINNGYGSGYFQVIDGLNDSIIIDNNGRFGALARYYIYSNAPSAVEHFENGALKIFPNPVGERLTIETSEHVTQTEIFNLQGQCVFAESNNGGSVDVSYLSSGVYLLRITTESGVRIEKFIKQ